jgi:hypothetical protein
MDFTRILNPGKEQVYATRKSNVFVKITYKDGRLSFVGVVGPRKSGDCAGGCGQIHPLKLDELNKGWTQDMIDHLNHLWERWHLNDMRAGDSAQESLIREAKQAGWEPNPRDIYHSTCLLLEQNGLLEHNGYRYGTRWKTEEVPANILEDLRNFPLTKITPAWV